VPGVAIAIVQDGRITLARGYGLRDVKAHLPVTADTRFGIGSTSKSFTVALLGMLVSQGRLDWDKPLVEYLPDFRLFDDYSSAHVTARDLVTHRTGLPRHEPAWFNADFSRGEMVRRLRYLEPSKGLRERFQYNNLMLMTAGYLAERLAGHDWEAQVQSRIFVPLGMKNSDFLAAGRPRGADFSLPYQQDDHGEVQEISFPNLGAIGPAGSISSTASDMAKYLLMYLSRGKSDGKQIVPEKQVEEMQTPQMAVTAPTTFPEIGFTDYGLGLRITPYRGHKLIHHAGAVDGFTEFMSFMPDEHIGIVVLTNLTGNYLPWVLSYHVYDRMLGLNTIDWDSRFRKLAEKAKEKAKTEERKKREAQKRDTKSTHPLGDYVGDYENPGYGGLRVRLEGGSLRLIFHGIGWGLKHYHYDVFEIPANNLEGREGDLVGTRFMFHSNWEGDIDSVSASLEPEVKDIVFKKRNNKRSR
jgi:CubicO group peptidase (beta-lactamase class C family)